MIDIGTLGLSARRSLLKMRDRVCLRFRAWYVARLIRFACRRRGD